MSDRKVWTAYAQADDITFIMEDTEDGSIEVVGFYFGEPTPEDTEYFRGKTKAVIED